MKFSLLTAALATSVAADFVVLTALPTPTELTQLLNLGSYVASLADYVTAEIASMTAAANASAVSEKAKMQKELEAFAATASYSIPSGVTAVGGLETFTTIPAWYSALPSEVKSYYDRNNKIVESLVFQAAGVTPTAATSATRSGTGAAAGQTGAANKVAVVGAGVVAAFLGVVVL